VWVAKKQGIKIRWLEKGFRAGQDIHRVVVPIIITIIITIIILIIIHLSQFLTNTESPLIILQILVLHLHTYTHKMKLHTHTCTHIIKRSHIS
jgi:hypothetical protein